MRPDSLLRLWRYINHLLIYRWFNTSGCDPVVEVVVVVERRVRGRPRSVCTARVRTVGHDKEASSKRVQLIGL